MLKVIFMAKETPSSLSALEYLCLHQKEVNVLGAVLRSKDLELQKICRENEIDILTERQLENNFGSGKQDVDYIISFYWKKAGKDILAIPKKGSINFHPGPLPEARGSGYHMAILENWGYWGVTAHYMDEEYDTGAIIECRRFDIESDIVNQDLVRMAHTHLFELFRDIMDGLFCGEAPKGINQEGGRYFSLKELEDGKLIGRRESVAEIDRKIRAYWNPPYTGAQVEIQGKRYTVINEGILDWIAGKLFGGL